jgi:uncharacterized radical SAM superfamily protein
LEKLKPVGQGFPFRTAELDDCAFTWYKAHLCLSYRRHTGIIGDEETIEERLDELVVETVLLDQMSEVDAEDDVTIQEEVVEGCTLSQYRNTPLYV